ncbi:MAG: DUF61 family protein [Candidatus Bathyarchaeia archaeon]
MKEGAIERSLKRLIEEEIRKIYRGLPSEKKTLEQLLLEETPFVNASDGSKIFLKKQDLNALAEKIPKEFHDKIKLPFIVLRRMDLGKSIYTVSGSKLEEFAIKRILGLTDLPFEKYEFENEKLYLYKPHVSELVRQLRSLIAIGFSKP